MKPLLQLKLSQHLAMTPQLQQAIRLLQLSTLALKQEVQAAIETNPMLEATETATIEEAAVAPKDAATSQDYAHGSEFSSPTWEHWHTHPTQADFTENNPLETLNGTSETLKDYLLWQMQLTPFNEADHVIATTIIDAINEDGFLLCSVDEIYTTLKSVLDIEKAEVEVVLRRIQQFDPPGIGARNLSECLYLQLAHLPQLPWLEQAKQLVCHHLDLLAKRNYPALRRRLGLSSEALREVISCIQSLNPRPGATMAKESGGYIEPDVFVYKKEGHWQVELNPACTPALQINRGYAALIRRADTSVDNQYLKQRLQEARWFLKSIETRNETLLKVAQCIVEQQKAFLEHGEQAMKPLTLQAIAQTLSLHESTISRVTTQKYLYTPRGMFELKYFFSSRLTTQEGEDCSATAIRALIKQLVGKENRQKPLSDNELTKLLEKQGINVARRTVAKYRESLEIPPSNERKELL